MKTFNYNICKLQPNDPMPFNLLLLADETITAIEKYIYQAAIYTAKENGGCEPIAVFALYRISDVEIEIKNIAVVHAMQGMGIGSWLLAEIKKIAAAGQYKRVIVGTPDNALQQVRFYEKNGFKKYAIKKNFFLENYTAPIIEKGVMLRDMLIMETTLSQD